MWMRRGASRHIGRPKNKRKEVTILPKPTIETAREIMRSLGQRPDRWGHYQVGEYRFKFQKQSIRIEKCFRYESGDRGRIHTRSYFYSRLAPGQLEGIVKLLTNKGGHTHGSKSERNYV